MHRVHGIGRYLGMETREMFGVTRDRLVVEFKGGDRVYVDSEDIGLIRKYTGGEEPKLSKMGGADWEKTRARVRKAVRDIAAELVILYRQRLATPGHAFAPDGPFQQQIEDAFPYEETPDQLKAIDETKADMERSIPMDRLICGDVGYGKTEVALRAAAKAVFDGTQVAVLVPTTLLASQHGQTFRERFANYPVRVEVLSRFLERQGAERGRRRASRRAASTSSIGTHRLLSDDIKFKNLGLLVVDEEQRFGVQHKERIKKLRTDVDVLTLSATPIPRTLEMSLTGIRDLSLVQTPPEDRQPILTYVGEYDPRAASEAIRRELLREGQVLVRAQPGARHRARRRRRARARARRTRRDRARPDGRGPARTGRERVLGTRARRARVHDDRRERPRHADGQHARRRPGRHARPRAALPAARPRRPARATRRTRTSSTRPTVRSPSRRTSA